jgi:hypothetical protein
MARLAPVASHHRGEPVRVLYSRTADALSGSPRSSAAAERVPLRTSWGDFDPSTLLFRA